MDSVFWSIGGVPSPGTELNDDAPPRSTVGVGEGAHVRFGRLVVRNRKRRAEKRGGLWTRAEQDRDVSKEVGLRAAREKESPIVGLG